MRQMIKHPKSWLQESLLLSLIVPPFGLAALFYAAKVIPLSCEGNFVASYYYANKAKRYIRYGFFFLIAAISLLILVSLFWFFMSRALIR